MAALVLDIAWARPTVAQIRATGAVGVVRYFSKDDTKDLTAAEVTSYLAAGLAVGTVYETTAGRATAGRAAGVADARAAEAKRKSRKLPPDHVIYFAVDTDTTWPSVVDYFAGVLSVLPVERVGCYGGFEVIQGAYKGGIQYLWQTLAWSGGRLSPVADLYQSGGTVLGGSADINKVTSASGDWGQTPRPIPPEDIVTPQDIKDITSTLLGTTLGRSKVTVAMALQTTAQQVAGLTAAVAALAARIGTDEDTATIVAAVEAAIENAVIHVDITGPSPASA